MKDKKRLSYEKSWCQKGIHFYKQQEFQIIKELSKNYSIKILCEIMNVNRSSYYKWLKRKNNPSQKILQREKDIILIKKIHHKHPSHGYRWINAYAHSHYNMNWSDKHYNKYIKCLQIKFPTLLHIKEYSCRVPSHKPRF